MSLRSSLLSVNHGFFTRIGDERKIDHVRNILGAKKMITAKQVHSNIALHVKDEGQYEADALVTDKPGIAVAVFTADCAPILFHDKAAGLVAATHAGWRGARYGIIESTINLMKEMGAKDIIASVGPCIHQRSYEVGAEFIVAFTGESQNNKKFFAPGRTDSSGNKYSMFDLPGYIENKLKQNGIEKLEVIDEDTLTQPDKFFSFRRGTIVGEKETGRQISGICLG